MVDSANIYASTNLLPKPNDCNKIPYAGHEISLLLLSSSLLEIEFHDGKAEQGCKEHCERHHHGSCPPHPAVLEVEVILDIHLHRPFVVVHGRHDVTKLRHHQPVQGPCHGAYPAVPSPPYWHFLKITAAKNGNELWKRTIENLRYGKGLPVGG
jgi:hypothetical protein